MPFQALAAAAVLLSVTPHGNRFDLALDHGSAQMGWLSSGTFRFRRVPEGKLPDIAWTDRDPVAIQVIDSAESVKLRSKSMEVEIRKKGVLVSVRRLDGGALMEDLSEPQSEAGGVVWERRAAPGVEFYGLGPRNDARYGLRGLSVRAGNPFLLSTAGYGEFHAGRGAYRFDFTAADRYRVQAPAVDYYFYYGPTPKEIFEEHRAVREDAVPWMVSNARFPSWPELRASLVRILQGAISASNAPVFDLSLYSAAPEDLKLRAKQLGSLVAQMQAGDVGKSGLRTQLGTFYGSYVAELQDRGFPVWHPLPFQFPHDPESARHMDEFMLGDEMLIAPFLDPGDTRSVYLPPGTWTNLETNEAVRGPATVTVQTKSLPVWAKNGSIVPLDSAGAIALHYFPKSGGEFFLLEADIAEYSQAHASPALDFYRLEIESKKERNYQWVVHHVERPASVSFEGAKYREAEGQADLGDRSWWWDTAAKNLHVRVKVKAGEDCIVNVEW